MTRQLACLFLAAMAWSVAALATAPDAAGRVAESQATDAAHAWWDAFARGDEARFAALTADTLTVTLGVGATFDRDGAIAQARQHVGSAYTGTQWRDDQVQLLAPGVAVVTSSSNEGFARMRTDFRYLAVLHKQGGRWRVTAAQSTRVLAPSPRVAVAEAGALASFEGSYDTPNGKRLAVRALADALTLVDPGGQEVRLEPIGRDLFELPKPQAASGILRFLFLRDASGRVTALMRLGPQVVTYPRAAD